MTHRTDDEVMGVPCLAQRAAGFADGRHARRGRQRHGRAGRARRRCARAARAVPRRRGPGPDRGEHLSLLRPLALGPAQRVPHAGGGGRPGGPSTRSHGCARQLARDAASSTRPTVAALDATPPSATRGPPSAPRRPPTPARPTCCAYLYAGTARRTVVPRDAAPVTVTTEPAAARSVTRSGDALQATRSARRSPRRWRATPASSSTARTSPTTAARSSSPRASSRRSGATACSTRRSPRRPSAARPSARRWPALRPVVELMYMDFALMASDQIANQAAQVALHVGRPVDGAARDPRLGRRRQGLRRPALPVARERCSPTRPGL